jgi:hypothetical protein
MTERMTAEAYNAMVQPGKKPHKYGAKIGVYNGVAYDSKREAADAQRLDMLLAAGKIAGWNGQIKIELGLNPITGRMLSYKPDFEILALNGDTILYDSKGMDTEASHVRRAWAYQRTGRPVYTKWQQVVDALGI